MEIFALPIRTVAIDSNPSIRIGNPQYVHIPRHSPTAVLVQTIGTVRGGSEP